MMSEQPLENVKVLITRGSEGAREMSSLVESYGGVPVVVPLLRFQSYMDSHESTILSSLHNFEWIIFTSKNGVKYFLEALERIQLDVDSFTSKFAAVGSKTKQYCEQHRIPVSFVPDHFTANDFAAQFISKVKPSGEILIPKGNLARDIISAELSMSGVQCTEWIVYETVLPKDSMKELKRIVEENLVDVLTFTSSSTVHHFMEIIHHYSLQEKIKDTPIGCIGPITKSTIEEYGLHVKICPNIYTVNEMVKDIITYMSLYKHAQLDE
ncbi:uroporphyrinogen-III synthase [Rossellomorea aquimaris]|uniref:uroporphyrinogen-III synthase n=1 Tax=Rossellomorea aquimaris TaxID=189382 RepID=UPI0007D04B4E|nr:uroporphyrinogen-III synthase [Rossellomorea aquimaris]